MHRPLQHVRHFGHRGKLRRGPVERIAGQRRAIDRTFSHQLRTQRERSGPTASWRSRRPVSHWPKRGILRGAQAARQGGGISCGSPIAHTASRGLDTPRCGRNTWPGPWAGSTASWRSSRGPQLPLVAAPCTRPAAHRCRRLPANPLGIFDPACQGTFVLNFKIGHVGLVLGVQLQRN